MALEMQQLAECQAQTTKKNIARASDWWNGFVLKPVVFECLADGD